MMFFLATSYDLFKITVFYFNVFKNVIYSCHGKDELSDELLQSSVPHDPSQIILICWFGDQDTFPEIINVKNSCAA